MIVRFVLANRFPMLLWWGPDYLQIYNDAYAPILGAKHPNQALGRPFRECWAEVFDVLGPLVDVPFNGGQATWMDDIELIVRRRGFAEESHFTIAYSPVPDDEAPRGIGGVLGTVIEITEKVIGERRLRILSELGSQVAEAKTAEEACQRAAGVLAGHPKDVPFGLLYLCDEAAGTLRLAGSTRFEQGGEPPEQINVESPQGEMAVLVTQAICTGQTQMSGDLSSKCPVCREALGQKPQISLSSCRSNRTWSTAARVHWWPALAPASAPMRNTSASSNSSPTRSPRQ
jgi:hypothetical protein